jgi:hypothetical protein
MAIGVALVAVRKNALIYRLTATAAADTATISNATLKTDYKDPTSALGRMLHSTNTVANTLKNAITATRGRVTITPENNDAMWAVAITEGAGPAFAVQADIIGGSANLDTAILRIEAISSEEQ